MYHPDTHYTASSLSTGSYDHLTDQNKMVVRVRDIVTKSFIDTYRGTTRAYAFRLPSWATVSYW